MKVFLSMDMEGVAGICFREQTSPQGYDYSHARQLMISECNAAIEGCLQAGATEVVVSDSHGGNGFKSLMGEQLHPDADLITGMPRPFGQMATLDHSYDALIMVGYHTRHGALGVLNHTLNGQVVSRLTINGMEYGEIGMNAGLAGHFKVPVAMVSGDADTIVEAQALLPWTEGAVVKWAISRYAERALHPKRAQAVIRAAACRALQQRSRMKPLTFAGPIDLEIRFKDTGMAEMACHMPGVSRIDQLTLGYTATDFRSVFAVYETAIDLGNSTRQ